LRSRLGPSQVAGGGSGGKAGKVVFFPDIYADYNDPELGLRAIRLLQEAGYQVEVPAELKWGGMPYVSYGELKKATVVAKHNLDVLEPYLSAGYSVTSTEPTAVYMLKEVYPKLVPGETSAKAEECSSGFFKFLQKSLPDLKLTPAHPTDGTVGFHIPCHERALTNGAPAIAFLERAGYTVKVVETGTCCGMAGTFGMKHGALGYDLSMAVGDRLFKLFNESKTRLVASESSVCATQINDGTALKVMHPLYFVSGPAK
jgi:Fe-S oxidoreductase